MNPFDRIYQNMSSLYLWKEDYRDRIIALQGDLAEEKFGLDNEMYEQLAEQIDIIFHCGAIVNFILPYSQLYGSNVFGTCEIIHLACHTSTCIPVHYISTTSVLSDGINDTQSIDTISPKQLRNGYAQSKWVAEKLIAKASRAGLPVITYRLGLILADRETGACNRNDFYTLLIAAIMKVKCYPAEAITAIISGLPANIAARNIVDLIQNKTDAYGNIYNIVDQQNVLSFESIFECIRNCGLQIESVTYNEWRNRLLNEKIFDSSLKSIGEFLSDNSFKIFDRLPSDSISSKQSQLNSSPLNNDYVIKWLTFLLDNMIIYQ
jgi:thioester reductase-like protein